MDRFVDPVDRQAGVRQELEVARGPAEQREPDCEDPVAQDLLPFVVV